MLSTSRDPLFLSPVTKGAGRIIKESDVVVVKVVVVVIVVVVIVIVVIVVVVSKGK